MSKTMLYPTVDVAACERLESDVDYVARVA